MPFFGQRNSYERCEITQKDSANGFEKALSKILLTKWSKLNIDHTTIVTVIKIIIEFLFCITNKLANMIQNSYCFEYCQQMFNIKF